MGPIEKKFEKEVKEGKIPKPIEDLPSEWTKEDREEVMGPIDKKFQKEVKEGKIPKPIEDLPSEWAKEDREIEGSKPDLAELEEDPSGL